MFGFRVWEGNTLLDTKQPYDGNKPLSNKLISIRRKAANAIIFATVNAKLTTDLHRRDLTLNVGDYAFINIYKRYRYLIGLRYLKL